MHVTFGAYSVIRRVHVYMTTTNSNT